MPRAEVKLNCKFTRVVSESPLSLGNLFLLAEFYADGKLIGVSVADPRAYEDPHSPEDAEPDGEWAED